MLTELESKGPKTPRTVTYFKRTEDSLLFNKIFFNISLGRNLCIQQEQRTHWTCTTQTHRYNCTFIAVLKDESSNLRVVMTTSALGMVVDFMGVHHVVNYGPPQDLESYMQAYGRAGRDDTT